VSTPRSAAEPARLAGPDPGGDSGPHLSPGFWLHHAALHWRAALDAALTPLALTPTQFILLATTGWLEHRGDPPTQQQVADGSGADRVMTSKIIRTLEDRGLITRRPDEADARAIRLALTPKGRTLARRATAVAQDVDDAFFGPTPESLRATLRDLANRSVR
jgi:DNA-binding MarR family transcriptional regulator